MYRKVIVFVVPQAFEKFSSPITFAYLANPRNVSEYQLISLSFCCGFSLGKKAPYFLFQDKN